MSLSHNNSSKWSDYYALILVKELYAPRLCNEGQTYPSIIFIFIPSVSLESTGVKVLVFIVCVEKISEVLSPFPSPRLALGAGTEDALCVQG